MRKLAALLTALSITMLVAAGCGNEEEGAASAASELVPAGVLMYGEASLAPEGDQKEAIDAILAKFPDGDQALAKLREAVEKELRESDSKLSYEQDVEPWLGDDVAFFVDGLNPAAGMEDAVVLVASEDDEKAEDALEKTAEGELRRKTYKDVEYMVDEENAAVVLDGFVAIGGEGSVKRVIDTTEGGEPLSDDEAYGNAVDDAADERLGLLYVNSPAILEGVRRSGMPLPESFGEAFKEPVAATLAAEDDGVVFEGSIPTPLGEGSLFGQGSELLQELPADSWLAMAQTDLRAVLDFYVELIAGTVGGRDAVEQQLRAATGLDLERDVLGWMGDFGVFVRGTSVPELNGAVIIETTDEEASGRMLAALRRLGSSEMAGDLRIGPLSAPGGGEGFSVTSPEIPQPVHLFQRDGRVVVAYGNAAASDAIDAREPLGDSPDFAETRDSLGDYDVSVMLMLEPLFQLVDTTEAGANPEWEQAQPYLEPLRALVAGTSGEGDELSSAMKIIVK
jgi:hypothetical protein